MKPLRLLLSLLPLLSACSEKGSKPTAPAAAAADPHEESILEFQSGQQRFTVLVAGIRDEKSFDAAMPAMDKIVADWRQVAEKLKKLDPPAKTEQERYRKMISDGHRSSEPIGKDMIRLALIESREEQLGQWLKSFTDAGGAATWEMIRLYGMTDYAREAAEPPKFDFGEIKLNPPVIPLPNDSNSLDAVLRRAGAADFMNEAGEAPEFELGKVRIAPPMVPGTDEDESEEADKE